MRPGLADQSGLAMRAAVALSGGFEFWLSTEEFAEKFDYTTPTVRAWCAEGRIPADEIRKIGGQWRIRSTAVPLSDEAWAAQQMTGAGGGEPLPLSGGSTTAPPAPAPTLATQGAN